MWRVEQAKNEIRAGWSFTSILHATDRRTGFPAFFWFIASVLLQFGTTSSAPMMIAMLQQWDGLCQEANRESREDL